MHRRLGRGGLTKIPSGSLLVVNGNPITLGYDQYGYNYQAHMFNGLYDNFSRPPVAVASGDVNLIMKWSDEWLANQGLHGRLSPLDRGLNAKTGVATGTSMGWLTNHMEGDCVTADGRIDSCDLLREDRLGGTGHRHRSLG